MDERIWMSNGLRGRFLNYILTLFYLEQLILAMVQHSKGTRNV